MPVCALVITLHSEASPLLVRPAGGQQRPAGGQQRPAGGQTARVDADMFAIAGLTLGPRDGRRIAAVIESEDLAQQQARVDALTRHPEVGLVELAYADFSDVAEVPAGAPYLSRSRRGNHR